MTCTAEARPEVSFQIFHNETGELVCNAATYTTVYVRWTPIRLDIINTLQRTTLAENLHFFIYASMVRLAFPLLGKNFNILVLQNIHEPSAYNEKLRLVLHLDWLSPKHNLLTVLAVRTWRMFIASKYIWGLYFLYFHFFMFLYLYVNIAQPRPPTTSSSPIKSRTTTKGN